MGQPEKKNLILTTVGFGTATVPAQRLYVPLTVERGVEADYLLTTCKE